MMGGAACNGSSLLWGFPPWKRRAKVKVLSCASFGWLSIYHILRLEFSGQAAR